jgi:cation diffusion facilitator CzcD-associated flavoprotein CzcO
MVAAHAATAVEAPGEPEQQECVGTVVVGAGVCGLQAASRLMRDGIEDFVVLERQPGLGGVWAPGSWANASSCVQVSEPNYRLLSEHPATEFTPRDELLEQMQALVDRDGFAGKLRFGADVRAVRTVDAAGRETHGGGGEGQGEGQGGQGEATARAAAVRVSYTDAASGLVHVLLATNHVLLCTGGLQTPRDVELPGEGAFGGGIIRGIGSEVDTADLQGKRVCVLGMGAFAVEAARTALLQGADHVTIVARGRNLVIPRMLLASATLQAGADTLYRPRNPPKEPPGGTPEQVAKARDDAQAAIKRGHQMLQILATPCKRTVCIAGCAVARSTHIDTYM